MNESAPRHLDWSSVGAFEVIKVPVWVLDVERGRMLWANAAALALWQASSLADMQSAFEADRSEAARARLNATLEMVRAGQTLDDFWTAYPNGNPVTFEASCSGMILADLRLGVLVQGRPAGEREFPGELKRRVESYRHAPSPISLHTPDGTAFMRNPAAIRAFGPLDEDAARDDLAQQLGGTVEAAKARAMLAQQQVQRQRVKVETRIGLCWFDVELRHMPDPLTGRESILFSAQDVTAAQLAEQRLAAEKHLLEMISTGKPLVDVLDALTREVEDLSPDMRCSVLLLDDDGVHFRHIAAPSLPEAYRKAIDGSAIGPRMGACGVAMHRRETVIVSDIANDPLWEDYRALAAAHELRACWSVPIRSSSGQVLGSFAAYYRLPRAPSGREMELLETGRHIAGVAVDRDRAIQALRTRSEQLQMVMDAMPFSIAFADRNFRYVVVNRRFEELFGRSREQVIGKQTWEVIGQDLFDRIKPHMDRVMLGEEVKYERESTDESGNDRHMEVQYLPLIGEDGAVQGHFGIVHDITERKRDEALVQFLANHDHLTQLPNRNQFSRRLGEAVVRAARYGNRVGVLFIDLDRFKNVNDTLGHEGGDALLVAVAGRFSETVRATDTVARLGGDEFTVILSEIGSLEEAAASAQRLLTTLALPFVVQNQELFVSASIGISIYPDDGVDVTTLLRNADMAMYRAKDMGKNIFQFFSREATEASMQRLSLESSLRRAIDRSEFVLHHQPIVDIENNRIVGMESLVRWNRPDTGLISPATFIPIAEETGLIVPIGDWVLEAACRQVHALHDSGHAGLRIAVNLSPRQFRRRDMAQAIADTLAKTGLAARHLELEITESSMMENPEAAVRTLHALKEMGVHLSIDDFGTGYSSLSQLKRFPINALKIDQSFVRDIPADEDNAAIASAIIAMGQRLRLTLVAEGVETPEQLAFLRERGCRYVQGFLFSRALPADQLSVLLANGLPKLSR